MFSEPFSLTYLLSRPAGMLVYYLFTALAIQAGWAMSVAEWRNRGQWIYGRTLLAFSIVFASLVLSLSARLLPLRGIAPLPGAIAPLSALLDTAGIIALCWAFQSRVITAGRPPIYLGINLAAAGLLHLLFTAPLPPQIATTPGAGWQQVVWLLWQAVLCGAASYLIYYRRRDRTGLQAFAFGMLAAGRALSIFDVRAAIEWSNLLAYPLLTISLYRNIVHDLKEFVDELQSISAPASRQTRQLIFSLESARATAASLELDTLLPKVTESVALAMNADHAGIFLSRIPATLEADADLAPPADRHAALLVAAFYHPLRPSHQQMEPLPLMAYQGLARALKSGRQMRFDPASQADEADRLARHFDVPALGDVVIQPLAMKGQVLGVLIAARYGGAEPFAGDELRLCEALGSQIAVAIVNAEFYRRLEHQAVLLADLLNLQQQETSKNQAILESIIDGVVVCDAAGDVTLVNEAAARLLDAPREALLDEPISKLYARIGLEEFPRFTRSREHTFRADSLGTGSRVLQGSVALVQAPTGDSIGQVIVFRDVTSELRAEQAKSEFLATVSHELRTPVTSIKGFADLLSKGMAGELPASVRGFLETISMNADRMARLVDNILYVSEAERGEIVLQLHKVDAAGIIAKAVNSARPAFAERRIEVSLDLEENLPQVELDPAGFRQMLDNLLQNACKFTPRGGRVWVSASHHLAQPESAGDAPPAGPHRCLLIAVRDTGVGIAPDDHDRVFERFYRAANPLTVEAGGAGIGLTIVKSLVEAHGGRVWVDGEIGEGSQFNVVLPILHPRP